MTSILGKYVIDKLREINDKRLSYFGIDVSTISAEEKEEIIKMEAQEKILLEITDICEKRGRY